MTLGAFFSILSLLLLSPFLPHTHVDKGALFSRSRNVCSFRVGGSSGILDAHILFLSLFVISTWFHPPRVAPEGRGRNKQRKMNFGQFWKPIHICFDWVPCKVFQERWNTLNEHRRKEATCAHPSFAQLTRPALLGNLPLHSREKISRIVFQKWSSNIKD